MTRGRKPNKLLSQWDWAKTIQRILDFEYGGDKPMLAATLGIHASNIYRWIAAENGGRVGHKHSTKLIERFPQHLIKNGEDLPAGVAREITVINKPVERPAVKPVNSAERIAVALERITACMEFEILRNRGKVNGTGAMYDKQLVDAGLGDMVPMGARYQTGAQERGEQ